MEKITIKTLGGFTDMECPYDMKKWSLMGKEEIIMAGSYSCKTCKFHKVLPLAGQNTFGCIFKKDIKNERIYKNCFKSN